MNKVSGDTGKPLLTLFIAGDLPNSRRARTHFENWRVRASIAAADVEVIDVLQNPQRAAEEDIFITPALVFSGTDGRQIFVGDLSDNASLGSLQSIAKGSNDTS